MTTIETLQVFDIEATLDLAEEFNKLYAASKKFNRRKLRSILEASLVYDKNFFCCVMKEETKVVGLLIGLANEGLYFDDVLASELGWYVQVPYRGVQSLEMLTKFETWAKEKAKANFVVMSYTVNMSKLDKLYEKLGYEVAEFSYKKELS